MEAFPTNDTQCIGGGESVKEPNQPCCPSFLWGRKGGGSGEHHLGWQRIGILSPEDNQGLNSLGTALQTKDAFLIAPSLHRWHNWVLIVYIILLGIVWCMSHTFHVSYFGHTLSVADFESTATVSGYILPSSPSLVAAEPWLLQFLFKVAPLRHTVPLARSRLWWWRGVKPPFCVYWVLLFALLRGVTSLPLCDQVLSMPWRACCEPVRALSTIHVNSFHFILLLPLCGR